MNTQQKRKIKKYAEKVLGLCVGETIPPHKTLGNGHWEPCLQDAYQAGEIQDKGRRAYYKRICEILGDDADDWMFITHTFEDSEPNWFSRLESMRQEILLHTDPDKKQINWLEPQDGNLNPNKYLRSLIERLANELLQEAEKRTQKKSKPKTKPKPIKVPLYPFDEQNTEKAILSDTELILVNRCLAPRVRHCVLSQADVTYHFEARKSDMDRLRQLFRRFLVDKGMLTENVARRMNFFELIGALSWEVQQETDRLNSSWIKGLRGIWDDAVKHKEHWQEKTRQFIDLLGELGEHGTEVLLPRIVDEESESWEGFRLPIASDLPWMYWVLGEVLEIVFGLSDVLIRNDDAVRLCNKFPAFDRAIKEKVWWYVSLEDCRLYGSFVASDLIVNDKRKPYIKDSKQQESASREQEEKNKQQPLSDKEDAVVKLLEALPERKGLTGRKILESLDKQQIYIDQSTLTKSIIPRLKDKGYKIKNNRDGAGYYLEK